jgi:hypothetical protein
MATTTALEDRGQEAAGPQFGEQQGRCPPLGRQGAGPGAVAVAEPLFRPFVPVSTDHGGGLDLDQLLQAVAGQLGDQLTGSTAIRYRREVGGGTVVLGMVRLVEVVLEPGKRAQPLQCQRTACRPEGSLKPSLC